MGSSARTIDLVQNDTPDGESALSFPVLVLNRNYQAINIITVRKALGHDGCWVGRSDGWRLPGL